MRNIDFDVPTHGGGHIDRVVRLPRQELVVQGHGRRPQMADLVGTCPSRQLGYAYIGALEGEVLEASDSDPQLNKVSRPALWRMSHVL